MASVQKRATDEPGTATGVEDERIGGQVGEPDKPRKRLGIGLDRSAFELGGLAVECISQGRVMIGGRR
jgi:hypothetical protein